MESHRLSYEQCSSRIVVLLLYRLVRNGKSLAAAVALGSSARRPIKTRARANGVQ